MRDLSQHMPMVVLTVEDSWAKDRSVYGEHDSNSVNDTKMLYWGSESRQCKAVQSDIVVGQRVLWRAERGHGVWREGCVAKQVVSPFQVRCPEYKPLSQVADRFTFDHKIVQEMVPYAEGPGRTVVFNCADDPDSKRQYLSEKSVYKKNLVWDAATNSIKFPNLTKGPAGSVLRYRTGASKDAWFSVFVRCDRILLKWVATLGSKT